jgi:hypothetical protein
VTDLTRVRYHVRDTVESTALFSDEEINFVLDEESSVQNAVISLLRAKIGELANEDDFKADWLQVDSSKRLAALNALLQQKLDEFEVSSGTAGVVHRYRPDSAQHEEPDYSAPDYDYGTDDDFEW